jgi:hypothetical protein
MFAFGPRLFRNPRQGFRMLWVIQCRSFFLVLFFAVYAFCGDTSNKKPLPKWTMREELNQRAIHDLYNSGDFEPVIEVLERFQKNNRTSSFSDSVFIAKHLAVVYSATPKTREKGRYYMMRLLELVPTAKLIDMFVSDEIDRIFEKVREEFVAKQHGFGLDSLTLQLPDRPKEGVPEEHPKQPAPRTVAVSFWRRPTTWVMGGLAVAAIGTATYLYVASDESDGAPPREVFVPKPDNQ